MQKSFGALYAFTIMLTEKQQLIRGVRDGDLVVHGLNLQGCDSILFEFNFFKF